MDGMSRDLEITWYCVHNFMHCPLHAEDRVAVRVGLGRERGVGEGCFVRGIWAAIEVWIHCGRGERASVCK